MPMSSRTAVSIVGQDFHINGRPTYPGRTFRGMRIEGLLMNARLVQGAFDDRNPDTRSRFDYPDGPWDPQRNTDEFIAAMPAWRDSGLVSFTINCQGGSPEGYSQDQPWHNSAFEADGSFRADYKERLGAILDAADRLGMAPILGLFYFGQDERLADESAVVAATDAATDWLCERGDRHVMVEIANEADIGPRYEHRILSAERGDELIRRVQQRSDGRVNTPAGRLLVSTSMRGGTLPPEAVTAAGDFVLLHGNGVDDPNRIREMVRQVRSQDAWRGQPIVFNEDDHFAFDAEDNNMIVAVGEHAGWGFFDWRMKGEDYHQGYQSVPVDWQIRSGRKRGFFGLLAEMTGHTPPAP